MSLTFTAPEPQIFGAMRDRSYPSPLELLHISIMHKGPGIDDLVRFYQVVLNMRFVFKVSYPTFEFIALSPDDENHRIGFVNDLSDTDEPGSEGNDWPKAVVQDGDDPRGAPLRNCRIEHTSWLFRDFEAVLLTAKRIHDELGIWPRSARHGGLDLTIDYNDPDGNRVELLSQCKSKGEILFGLHERANQMKTGKMQFTEMFMPLNIGKMIALYESGISMDQLTDREYCKVLIAEGRL